MRTWIIVLTLLIGTQAIAQPRKDRIREARIDFMKKKLALTPEEEKAFIPLYSDMLDELDSLRRQFKHEVDLRDVDLTFMTDKECETLIQNIEIFRTQELAITQRYSEQFKKVLPIKKVAMIYKAEFEFRRELVERLREGRGR
ncbi:MAG: hypothetical protein LPK45_05775 [Bacteroidota bacterium]|nr:hypothetical protein [Bacteroidota bacterium]MDX5430577.1 hypothetical protein [Bacteroidota bacterium]MDX5469329.1 hypothetical protein [Bacteroidota bacterium]